MSDTSPPVPAPAAPEEDDSGPAAVNSATSLVDGVSADPHNDGASSASESSVAAVCGSELAMPSSASPSPSASSTTSGSSADSAKPINAARTTARRAASLSAPSVPPTAAVSAPYLILSVESPSGRTARVEATASDLVLEVRQFLLSCPETCEYTAYHLTHQGVPLNDYAELGSYESLMRTAGSGAVELLKIAPEFYDERGVRMHVKRVRDMLVSPPHHVQSSLVLTLDDMQDKERRRKAQDKDREAAAKRKGKDHPADDDASTPEQPTDDATAASSPSPSPSSSFSLTDFFSHAHAVPSVPPPLPCLHALTYSAFNPPPGNRRLRGDLLYVEVHTLEAHSLHVTASVDGFFVNQSTAAHFDPLPAAASYASSTLVELLRRASPLFAARFATMINRRILMHPFQQSEVVGSEVRTWLVKAEEWRADAGRAEDALLSSYGMDVRGVLRDWNEEVQACMELLCLSEDERIRRDAHLQRVYTEYVQAAREGVVAILDGHITPVNALDPLRQHVWVFNSIFFSHALDARDLYPAQWGDRVAHKQANADIHGAELLMNLHLPGLHSLATALIDYRGHRLIAQSIIPGIFHSDTASKHVYGSMDQGQTVLFDADIHSLMQPLARAAHLGVHDVYDAKGDKATLVTAVDTKGIVGSDHRAYALDLMRTTPRDAQRRELKDVWAVLRFALVERYVRRAAMDRLFSVGAEDDGGPREERQLRQYLEQQMQGNRAVDSQYIDLVHQQAFHPDLFLHTKHPLVREAEVQPAVDEAVALSTFLTSSVVPSFVASIAQLDFVPADGEDLTRMLHEAGINVRYLGDVCREAEKRGLRFLVWMAELEMVVRGVKCIVREELRDINGEKKGRVESWYYGSVLVRALNAVVGRRALGTAASEDDLQAAAQLMQTLREERDRERGLVEVDGAKEKKAGKKGKKAAAASAVRVHNHDGRKHSVDPLHPVNLWVAVREAVQEKFEFTLPPALPLSPQEKLVLLRSVCRRLGVVLVARELDFGADEPLGIADVSDLVPVVKTMAVVNEDCEQLVHSAVASMQQGHLTFAYQYLSDALTSHNHVYGPMHPRTANAYHLQALACYHGGDIGAAVDNQQRSLIILERCVGVDDARTAHAHLALSLYLQSAGHTDAALVHCGHARWIYELLGGEHSLYLAAACMNTAMLLQTRGRFQDALRFSEDALKKNIQALGDHHVHVGLRSVPPSHTRGTRQCAGMVDGADVMRKTLLQCFG